MAMPSRADCESLDARDPLGRLIGEFAAGEPGWLYFDANSIGAMPRAAQGALGRIADEWRRLRRRGWKDSDWLDAPVRLGNKLAPIIGAEPGSVVVCDSTSVNIYKAVRMALALRPGRKTVVAEAGAFPTDLYVAEAAAPVLKRVDSLTGGGQTLGSVPSDTAAVLVTHTDYRSAYRHDLAALCRAAHERGALVVCDASHSAGAVEVGLAASGADFGVGCGYKYLCGGPGAPAWLYVAPRHQSAAPVIPGWMGHADPMAMSPDYKPAPGAKRHLAGTPPVAGNALMEAALDLWRDIDPQAAFAKHAALGDLLIRLVEQQCPDLSPASPHDPARRGGFVSFRHRDASAFADALEAAKVVASYRAPDVVRFGLSPLYHRYADIWALGERLRQLETVRMQ
jgi:kynureninase